MSYKDASCIPHEPANYRRMRHSTRLRISSRGCFKFSLSVKRWPIRQHRPCHHGQMLHPPPPPPETEPWDVEAATALLCLAACSLRDDGEQDAFNAAYINAAAAAVSVGAVPPALEHSSWAAALKPLARSDARKRETSSRPFSGRDSTARRCGERCCRGFSLHLWCKPKAPTTRARRCVARRRCSRL